MQQDRTILQRVARLLAAVDAEWTRWSAHDPWKEWVPFLMPLPGLAVGTRMTVLAASGDVTRFPSAKQLVGYSGLGASVQASGQIQRAGPLTKQGRRELRTVLVAAAWSAVDHHPDWHAEFARLVPSLGKGKAMVALARKLRVVVWHVLTHQVADRPADGARVTRKRQRWGKSHHSLATQHGLSSGACARQQLRYRGLGPSREQGAESATGGETLPARAAPGP